MRSKTRLEGIGKSDRVTIPFVSGEDPDGLRQRVKSEWLRLVGQQTLSQTKPKQTFLTSLTFNWQLSNKTRQINVQTVHVIIISQLKTCSKQAHC